jgi:DNA-binding protein YbaB
MRLLDMHLISNKRRYKCHWRRLPTVLLLFSFCCCRSVAFSILKRMGRTPPALSSATGLSVNFGWFSGNNDNADVVDEKLKDSGKLGGVASMVKNMESLQTAQKYGKLTAALVNELEVTPVEGQSPDGKVKVIVNCQQRPLSVSIDEGYFEASDVSDVKQAILAAMEDAYEKSIERTDLRMKSFYKEIGI